MWYDEDFYYEPSEFEQQMDEFKENLAKSVKSEFLEEMERLREENKNLQAIKEQFEQIKRDYERKHQECERTMREAEEKAKRMKTEELMEHFKVCLWGISWKYLYGQKCDKCDKERYVEVALPSGKKVKDECDCRKTEAKVMHPIRKILYEISDRNREICAWYESVGKEGDKYYRLEYACSTFARNIIEHGTSFEEIEKLEKDMDILFKTKEECMAYCEYLNKKNSVLSDILYKRNGEIYNFDDID